MPLKFNPLSSTFDLVGSGGGGTSYIDGEVQNFSALPETLGTPPVDSAYLVREAEGTWLLSRRPAGIYIRTANTGTRADDWTHAGAFPDVFNDANFVLYDNADSTKNLAFQLSGITTGQTRTLTAPDASGTIALTSDFAAPPAIGSTTPAAGTFTTLAASNNGTALTVTDTTTSINYDDPFVVERDSTILMKVRDDGLVGAGSGFNIGTNAVLAGLYLKIRGDGRFEFSSTGSTNSSSDLVVRRDGAGTLAQRDGTNPQTFNIYNTYTDATTYERGFLKWDSNILKIGVEAGSVGGTLRDIEIHRGSERLAIFTRTNNNVSRLILTRPDGASSQQSILESLSGTFRVYTNGTLRFQVDGANNIITGAEDTSYFISNTFPNARNTIYFGGGSVPSFRAVDGHYVEIYGGDADAASGTDRDGGPVTIRGGKPKGSGAAGSVILATSAGTKRIETNNTGLGFFNTTPAAQPAAIADATDAATTQARLNDLLAAMRTLGLIAT